MFYAYIIYDPVKEEPFYVGKGSKYRIGRHIRCSPNKHVRTRVKNLRESGHEPIFHKIDCSSEQIAFELEKGLIKKLGRRDLNKGTLFNFTDGGEGSVGGLRPDLAERNRRNVGKPSWNKNKKWSEETKNKMKKSKTEEHKKNISIAKSGEKSAAYGTIWITNGIICKQHDKFLDIPKGFKKGRILPKYEHNEKCKVKK